MNRRQSSKIYPGNKPALTYRFPGPGGMTLVEVLVAMVILLVGIWAVAAGFPRLFGVLAGEEKRTEMARLAEARLEQFKTNPYALPLAIAGDPYDNVNTPYIHPDSIPEDPDVATDPPHYPNSRDDILWVEGEGFVVPAVYPGAAAAVHVFNLGLAQGWTAPATPLTTLYEIREATEGTDFTVNTTTGQVQILTGYDAIEISYAWRDDLDPPGVVHYVDGEVVAHNTAVGAIVDAHQTIVEGTAHGVGRIYFPVSVVPGAPAPGAPVQGIYGATLHFDPADVSAHMRVDYYLRTDPFRNDRLDLIMTEDRQMTTAAGNISLVGTGIDTSQPLFAPNTYIIAVDLNTGGIYEQGVGFDFATVEDYGRGLLTLFFANPEDVLGHTVRFYYRTTDQDMITVQKAPNVFMEEAVAGGTNYYTYTRNVDVLIFPDCTAGQTVAVDYIYDATNQYRVVGEMHTINGNPNDPNYLTIALNNSPVQSIIAVRGMSLKVRAWWRTQTGRLTHLDVDTILGLAPM